MTIGNEWGARARIGAGWAVLVAALVTLLALIVPAGAIAAPAISEYQTTGYQPQGYNATPFQPTTSAGSSLLSPMPAPTVQSAGATSGTLLTVNPAQTYQTMLGYGATLNDSAAYLLAGGLTPAMLATANGVTAVAGSTAMQGLFSPTQGIGLSYMRISIGGNDDSQSSYSNSSSLSLANDYVENDPAPGSTATGFSAATLSNFISHDQEYLIPVLKAARQDNPAMKITASAWTAPGWMKCQNYTVEMGASCQAFPTSGTSGFAGGALNPADAEQYADYLLEFILAYRAQGLSLDSISLGNEPMNENWSYPSMVMLPSVEATVAEYLKQGLQIDGLSTKIIGLDHNWNTVASTSQPSGDCLPADCYANQLLSDVPSGTVDDIAYHCYGGDPSNQDSITVGIMETECSTQGYYSNNGTSNVANPYTTQPASFAGSLVWDTGYLQILSAEDGDTGGVSGAGSQTGMLWNLAGDNSYGITINQGCTLAGGGTPCLPVADAANASSPVPEVGYYILGQLSKFVQPGAVRIGSTSSGNLYTVAFRDPNNETVLVVLNTTSLSCTSTTCAAPTSLQTFTVQDSGAQFTSTIAPSTVQTYTW